MIPTPDLSHLTKDDYEYVYEPAEDTFLFLDGLELEVDELRTSKPSICLEIGSGSGCVSAFLASILGTSTALFLCTDINQFASSCTLATGRQNKTPLDPIIGSLATPLLQRLRHSVDILLFNPPYVPTNMDEADGAQHTAGIQGSWAGGTDGMQVTDVFLKDVEVLLSDTGKFYLVAIKQNDIPGIRHRMMTEYGLKSVIITQRRAGREHLFIIKFSR
ncbi:hypothetical protein SERLA73DRAFT_119773 [Serpula lacrymans var. lacrymans S7.3]|uniref:Uncharacterized protein n=2 Tax=Serpula lacrymans var. lacrymans TaxID=341189 RepID=F8PMA4_SERL3|nr:uncharacterized protein SERLADRAFT_366146 [Serpula lacrymans var. lacrymans S7.9]EGO02736.1 hypothetical protein SERLA73DRAFT_119773 [Serpula lacrymans var. lacrymans S7.3]EGO28437.1 hypothetical protein SERLADRAFT_366146 [Serpula lacrymans var. lacrymans S7.9]